METVLHWSDCKAQKQSETLLHLDKLRPYLSKNSKITEYACGYGTLLNQLFQEGFTNSIGYDFSSTCIQKGKKLFSYLDLYTLQEEGKLPIPADSIDLVILSGVLTFLVNREDQELLLCEIERVLSPGGILYLSDTMICDHLHYKEKYMAAYKETEEWGLYETPEGLGVRHHTSLWLLSLLLHFDIHWFEQFDLKIDQKHPSKAVHCIAQYQG